MLSKYQQLVIIRKAYQLTMVKAVMCARKEKEPEEVLANRKVKGAKSEDLSRARQYGMFLSRELSKSERKTKAGWASEIQATFADIGDFYNRDHATVIQTTLQHNTHSVPRTIKYASSQCVRACINNKQHKRTHT
jgi:hypothetical protein